jgi:putative ABC transport system permease protein
VAIPFIYNIRSIRARYTSSLVAILSIAGVVAVFIAVLAMANGFQKTLVDSGSPRNALILRGGATSEMESALTLEQVRIIQDAAGVAKGKDNASLISPEVVVIAAFPLKATGTDANVQVRGVSDRVLEVRDNVRITEGRFIKSGLSELIAGRNAASTYSGFTVGNKVDFGGNEWTVVGLFDSGGTAFDSELWCDANVINQTYKRPENIFQSITARLTSVDAFDEFKAALSTDPRLTVSVDREVNYYAKQSQAVTVLIKVLGFLVASVMGVGAIFGAINTMYSAVSARAVEIATLRAIGFKERNVIVSFIAESLLISALGGILGALVILPINGSVASTMNWQTFSHISFAFQVSWDIILEGVVFALIMGFLGGLLPAYRASRIPVAVALRGL